MAKLIALPDGSTGSFPDDMDDGAITAVLRKQFPPQAAPKGFVGSAVDAAKNLGTGIATGAGEIGTALLAPVDLTYDAVKGQPLGTSNRLRRQSIESFGKENADTDSVNYTVGNAVPEIIGTGGPIAATGKAIVGKVLTKAVGRLAPAVGDIVANAGYSAAKAAYNGEDVGTAAATGGAGAAGGRLLTRTLGGIARPFVSKDAQTLIDAGVRPTPGQLFGDGPVGSSVRALEDKLASYPLVGDVIGAARRRSLSEYGNAEINAALRPLGASVDGSGTEAVEQAQRAVSQAYDQVLPQTFLTPQKAAAATRVKVFQNVPLLDGMQSAQVSRYVVDRINPLVKDAVAKGQPITGEAAKAIDSELGFYARKYSSSPNPQDHPMGDAFYELQSSLRGALDGTTPDAKQALTAANTAYRSMLPVTKAADRITGGNFTPRQLDRASGQYGQTPSDLSKAGQNVLPSTVPDSGSAGRILLGAGVATGTLTGHAVAAATAAAIYSGPGMRLIVNGLRSDLPAEVYARLMRMTPDQQRAAIGEFAKASDAFGKRASEVASQVGRMYAEQSQKQPETQE